MPVDEIRRALARIVASPAFSASPQLAAFLRFVVEATLTGQSDRIKGYTIAVEALGREDNFDPQADPIVRVEAGRLRRALDRYYDGPGRRDPVIIELPRGSYVPSFRHRQAPAPGHRLVQKLASIVEKTLPTRSRLAVLAAGLVGILGYAAIDLLVIDPIRMDGRSATPSLAPPAAKSGGDRRMHIGPSIFIAPITVAGHPRPLDPTPKALEGRLRDIFARFDDVTIISDAANGTGGERPKSDYRLITDVEEVDARTLNLRFQLVDESDGSIAWAYLMERLEFGADPRALQMRLGREVAGALLQAYGVVPSRERIKQASSKDRDPRYACILEAFEYFRTYNHPQHARVRGCLEDTTRHDPTFASGFSALARVYYREFLFDLSEEGAARSLDRALEAARTAIDLNPSHVRAYYVLMDVHMARGEIAEAMAAGERVIALNPYDPTAVFQYAAQLVLLGDVDRGLRLISQNVRHAGATPMRYLFVQVIAAYFRNDFAGAAGFANQLTNDRFPLGLAMQAVTRLNTGERERARQAAVRLAELFPNWRENPGRELRKYFPLPWVIERLERELRAAGLDATVSAAHTATPSTKMPMLIVEPIERGGTRPLSVGQADAIRAQIAKVFARFEDIDIYAPPVREGSASAAARFDYRLATTLNGEDNGLSVTLRLIEGDDGTVLWAKTYENVRIEDDGTLPPVNDAAAALLHPIGVVATRERIRTSDRPGFARYRCMLESVDYLRSFVPARHAKARACLEEAVAGDPTFASAHTTLARVYMREHQFSINARPGDSPPLERALAAATRAIELNPKSARAHFIMFEILAALGDVDGVRRHGEMAVRLNPNDQSVVFHYGTQLIMMGNVDAGAAIVRRIADSSSVPPARLDFTLFMASYLKGDMAEASRYAKRIGNDAFIPGHVAHALAAYRTEGPDAIRQALDRLAAVDPAWREDPRRELAKFITSPSVVERFATDLAAAGLGTPESSQSRAARSLMLQ